MFRITDLSACHDLDEGETVIHMTMRVGGVGPVTAMAQLIAMFDIREEPVDAPASTSPGEPGDDHVDRGSPQPDGGVVDRRRSRRRGGAGGEADASDQPVDDGRGASAPAAGEDVGSRDPKPSRRRRGTAAYSSGDEDGDGAAEAGGDGAGEAGGGDGSTSRRRRRPSSGDVSDATGDAGAPADGGRDRGAGAADTGDKLTNADLSKAASQAAEVITPAAVTELLGQFGVTRVNDIPDKDRREFVDILKDRVAQAKKGG